MKYIMILFVLASVADLVSASIVSQWKMDDAAGQTVVEDSISDNTGTSDNTITSTGGKYGNAISFNGTSDRIDCGNDSSLNLVAVNQANTFKKIAQSIGISSHQGVADDGTNLFTFDTTTLYKRNRTTFAQIASETLADIITAAGGDLDSTDHIGDGVVVGAFIYIPVEAFSLPTTFSDQHIVKLNKSDLTYSAHWDVSAQNHNVAGIASDGTYLYVVSYLDGSQAWAYDITDGTYSSGNDIMFSSSISEIQGITLNSGGTKFYVSSDDSDSIIEVDPNGTVGDTVYQYDAITAFEGLDYSQGTMYLTIDDGGEYVFTLDLNASQSGFTVMAWIKPDGVIGERCIISRYDYNVNKRQYFLAITGTSAFFRGGRLGGISLTEATKTSIITDGDWQHVAGVCDNDNELVKIYINAILGDTTAHADSQTVGFTDQTSIGGIITDGGNKAFFKGLIDDVRIYDTALSQSEIEVAMQETAGRYGGTFRNYRRSRYK